MGDFLHLSLKLGTLTLCGAVALFIARALRLSVPIRLSDAARRAKIDIDLKISWLVGSLDQALLIFTAVILTTLLLVNPRIGPLEAFFIMGRSGQLPTSMLAASAGLLVLLTFAASQARDVERIARDGNKYLGEPIAAYKFLRSWRARLLRQPAFGMLVVILFALPILVTLLPPSLRRAGAAPLVGELPRADDIFIALWCASFTLVASLLIVSAISGLRPSISDVTDPQRAKRLIRIDLQLSVADDWHRTIARARRSDNPRAQFKDWMEYLKNEYSDLDASERTDYLSATISGTSWLLTTSRLKSKATTLALGASRVQSKFDNALTASNRGGPLFRLGAQIAAWCCIERRILLSSKCALLFERAHRAREECLSEMLEALTQGPSSGEASIDERAKLVKSLLVTASYVTVAFEELRSTLGDEEVSNFLAPTIHLPDRMQRIRPRLHDPDAFPTVITTSAMCIRDISRIAYPHGYKSAAPRRIGIGVMDLIADAVAISHPPTRNYMIYQLIGGYISSTICRDFEDPELDSDGAGMNAPEVLIKLRQKYSETPPLGRREDGQHEVVEAIDQVALNAIISKEADSPTSREALLAVLPDTLVRCALLYEMLYARRSSEGVSAKRLSAFKTRLQNAGHLDARDIVELSEATQVNILGAGSSVSHFTTSAGIGWIVHALKTPLSLEKCIAFESRKQSFVIQELTLRDFVDWHMIAGRGLSSRHLENDIEDKETLKQFDMSAGVSEICSLRADWEPVDANYARKLDLWLNSAWPTDANAPDADS